MKASAADTYQIPYLAGMRIDVDPTKWADQGFRVNCRADSVDDHPIGFESMFRLSWDEQGLLAIFSVADPTPCEAADDKLYNGDSVELMLATKVGGSELYQWFLSHHLGEN